MTRESAAGRPVESFSAVEVTGDWCTVDGSDYAEARVRIGGESGDPTAHGESRDPTAHGDGETRTAVLVRPRLNGALSIDSRHGIVADSAATSTTDTGAATSTADRGDTEAADHTRWSTSVEQYTDAVERWAAVDDLDGVQSVIDWGVTEDGPWVLTEHVGGDTLGEHATGSDPDRVFEIAADCAETLHDLHVRGVTHRTLTPGRIRLSDDGPRVSDVATGAALSAGAGGLSALSPVYAAPEQFAPETYGDPGRRTDVYRLAAVVYEQLTGRPPYEGSGAALIDTVTDSERTPDPPSDHTPTLSATVDDILQTALAVDPADRYATAGAFAAALAGETSADWRQAGGTAARRGSLSTAGPTAPVEQFWTVDTGYDQLDAAPVVAEGTAYVGGADDTLYAVAVDTGHEAWTVAFDEPLGTPAAVAEETVVVTSGETLYGLDRADGEREWATTVGRVFGGPAVADGTVYLGTDEGAVLAVDAATGEREWTTDTAAAVRGGPAVAAGRVFVGDDEGTVLALDAETGDRRWESTGLDQSVETTPAVGFGTVYAVGGGEIVALDAADGSVQWHHEAEPTSLTSPAVADGRLFVGSEYGGLTAVDAETGESVFRAAQRETVTAPAVTDGAVVACTDAGVVRGVSTADGTDAWTAEIDADPTTAPALTDHGLVVGTADGSLLAVRSEEAAGAVSEFGVCGGDVSHPSVETRQSPDTEWSTADGTPARTRHVRVSEETAVGAPAEPVATRWEFAPAETLATLTRTSDGRHYTAAEHDDTLYAVDGDGTVAWSTTVPSRTGVDPVTDGDRVYTVGEGVGSDGARDLTNQTDVLTALDTETGEELWSHEGTGQIQTPTVIGGLVYVVDEGGLRALDAESGVSEWSVAVDGAHPPAVGYGTVYVLGDGTLTAFDAGLGVEQWTADVPVSTVGQPALAEERLVVAARDGSIVAVDAETGREEWTASVGGDLRTGVTVASDTVYAAADDGQLTALDAETGETAWTTSVGEGIRASLAVTDSVLCVPTREAVFALDTDTGEERWRFRTPRGDEASGLAVGAGTVALLTGDGRLRTLIPRAVQPAPAAVFGDRTTTTGDRTTTTGDRTTTTGDRTTTTGDRTTTTDDRTATRDAQSSTGDAQSSSTGDARSPWAADASSSWAADASSSWAADASGTAVTVAYGTVYAGTSDGSVVAYDPETGEKRWEQSLAGQRVASGITVADGRVYAGTRRSGLVYALDAATGEVHWNYRIEGASSYRHVDATPTVAHDTVYVGGSGSVGRLHALDAATGEERFRTQYERDVRESPTVADGWVYVADTGGVFHAVNPVTGLDEWTFEPDHGGVGPAVTVDDLIVVADIHGGRLHALDRQTGEPQWSASDAYTGAPATVDGLVCLPTDDGVVGYDPETGAGTLAVALDEATTAEADSEQTVTETDSEQTVPETDRAVTVTAADGLLYVGGRGTLTVVDPDGGHRRFRVSTGDTTAAESAERTLSHLTVAYDAVFAVVTGSDDSLHAVTPTDGAITPHGSLEEVETEIAAAASTVDFDDTVVGDTADGEASSPADRVPEDAPDRYTQIAVAQIENHDDPTEEELRAVVLGRLCDEWGDSVRGVKARSTDIERDLADRVLGVDEQQINYTLERLAEKGSLGWADANQYDAISFRPEAIHFYETYTGVDVVPEADIREVVELLHDQRRDHPQKPSVDRETLSESVSLDQDDLDRVVWYLDNIGKWITDVLLVTGTIGYVDTWATGSGQPWETVELNGAGEELYERLTSSTEEN